MYLFLDIPTDGHDTDPHCLWTENWNICGRRVWIFIAKRSKWGFTSNNRIHLKAAAPIVTSDGIVLDHDRASTKRLKTSWRKNAWIIWLFEAAKERMWLVVSCRRWEGHESQFIGQRTVSYCSGRGTASETSFLPCWYANNSEPLSIPLRLCIPLVVAPSRVQKICLNIQKIYRRSLNHGFLQTCLIGPPI